MADFDITELCEQTDVSPRTVHFYIQQGLLAPAGSPGPGARYGEGHVARIKLIRLLQKQHLPLAEIAKRTKGLTDDQVAALLAETKQRLSEPRGTALDYIRGVLAGPRSASRTIGPPPGAPLKRAPSTALPDGDAAAGGAARPERSQWERFTLADGIELHVRRPMSRIEQRQFEKLMAAARAVFSETEGEA